MLKGKQVHLCFNSPLTLLILFRLIDLQCACHLSLSFFLSGWKSEITINYHRAYLHCAVLCCVDCAFDAVQFDLNKHWYYNLWFVIYFIHLPLGEREKDKLVSPRNEILQSLQQTLNRHFALARAYHISFYAHIFWFLRTPLDHFASPRLCTAVYTQCPYSNECVHYTIESFDWMNQ